MKAIANAEFSRGAMQPVMTALSAVSHEPAFILFLPSCFANKRPLLAHMDEISFESSQETSLS